MEEPNLEECVKAQKVASYERTLYNYSPMILAAGSALMGLGYLFGGKGDLDTGLNTLPRFIYGAGCVALGLGIGFVIPGVLTKLVFWGEADPFLKSAEGAIGLDKMHKKELENIVDDLKKSRKNKA